MDEPTKRAWGTPELIVLVRSGPEEAVLNGCKHMQSGTGPLALVDRCAREQITYPCVDYCVGISST